MPVITSKYRGTWEYFLAFNELVGARRYRPSFGRKNLANPDICLQAKRPPGNLGGLFFKGE